MAELRWWHSGWKSASQCRGHEFNPWSRKISHAVEHLSLCAKTTEVCKPRAHARQQGKPLQGEARTLRWGEALTCLNYRKPACSKEAPVQSKIKKNFLKRAMTTKANINRQNYMKLQSICTTKKTIDKWKVNLLHWKFLLILYPIRS